MGCAVSNTKVTPVRPKDEPPTNEYERPKKRIMLISSEHLEQLNTTNEVRKTSSIEEEPYLKETTERKFREYADLLEVPRSNIVPRERFVAF